MGNMALNFVHPTNIVMDLNNVMLKSLLLASQQTYKLANDKDIYIICFGLKQDLTLMCIIITNEK